MELPIAGGCLCGAVRYECAAEPLRMLKCHCRDCQQLSGGPYTPVVVFPLTAFKITRGELKYYRSQSVLGRHNLRGFCANCGSRLTGAENPERNYIGVNAASLDDPGIFRSAMDIFVEDAQPWDLLDADTPKHAQYMPRK
ncbi:MAG TPA: GFA family protein [Verrucomicrobiae bacterium]|nr:GFA family protein [Verrucomicrobiae bacterium]